MNEPVWLRPLSTDEHVHRAVTGYRLAFGAEPEGVWSAPGRVNLIGEHTDYNGGLCLPLALPYRTAVAAGPADDGSLHLRSAQLPHEPYDGTLQDVGPGAPTGWAAYVAGVPWALRRDEAEGGAGHDSDHGAWSTFGLRAYVNSDVPNGAGLSSSAALSCSAALAVDHLAGLGLAADDAGRARLATACVHAENLVAGAPTGGMDQAAALRCAAGHALLLDCRSGLDATQSARQVPFDPDAHGLRLLVIDTQAPHTLVDGQYAERRTACERAAEHLGVHTLRDLVGRPIQEVLGALADDEQRRRVRHVLSEIMRVQEVVALLDEDRVGEIGPVLSASHASLRDDFEVSSHELDVAVESAVASGALGARMTGGGFGGSAIALVPADRLAAVTGAVVRAFASQALHPPRFAYGHPSEAGTRLA